ncbi:putative glyoxalase superfamily protein PhnB [Streptomyces sp. 3330]|uniref:VOC family protein n=1 Tax=Streptomyces sp. 3330 TaxID=2817755 RepID=UPI002863A1ED|nr:VOC family protein [Streptomyces sp. 3330]MDR6974117.1 putative glyoxalase superfamily protein PhnB [Streptomyces sp. 3330]
MDGDDGEFLSEAAALRRETLLWPRTHVITRLSDCTPISATGSILHAELRRGNVVIMIATESRRSAPAPVRGTGTGAGLYLWLPEPSLVEDWHRRAVAAGALSVIAPETTPWGSVRARVLDPEGCEWSAGTYRPGGPAPA